MVQILEPGKRGIGDGSGRGRLPDSEVSADALRMQKVYDARAKQAEYSRNHKARNREAINAKRRKADGTKPTLLHTVDNRNSGFVEPPSPCPISELAMNKAYREFFAKRGLIPPQVSIDCLMSL